ncbi:MAG: nitroreductase [Clostridia bacterium]|nr:nitroreductase [Clostridia bacterium]
MKSSRCDILNLTDDICKVIRARRSVRTFDGRALTSEDREKLSAFMAEIENPYGIPVAFRLLEGKEHGLKCPVVTGTELYVGGKVSLQPHAFEAFGYAFEMLVLYAQFLGIGTVWLGGTMNRSAYEEAMELAEGEVMPCASPLGYPAEKMSLREGVMRKSIRADERLPFEELFSDRSFENPLTSEKAGGLSQPLEAVRRAPSAVNKQPWRAVVCDGTVHFYLRRSKGFGHSASLDMQRIDVGIALCHFDLAAEENGLNPVFFTEDPQIPADGDTEYIASFRIG